MSSVLLVSKPVEPPWNDSSKNLVRDLARSMRGHTPTVMTTRGARVDLGRARRAGVYRAHTGFAPAFAAQARVMARLLTSRDEDLWHFFFAPNPRSSRAASLAARVRDRRTVQTVCSTPAPGSDPGELLFADVSVVLSEHTLRRFVASGVPRTRLRRIPPSVPSLEPLDPDARRRVRRSFALPETAPLVVYPGDLEVGRGARLTLEATGALDGAHVVMACRSKTPAAHRAELALRARARDLGGRVHWVGETSRILELLGAADVVALPSETLYAKMDYPLAILETMSLAVPTIVAAGTPAAELAEGAVVVDAQVASVTDALASLFASPEEREMRGAAGRALVQREHRPQTMAARYEALYDELLR